MRKLIIPIVPETRAMLGEINGGVVPDIESEATWLVYNGEENPTEIITRRELRDIKNGIMLHMHFKD